MIEKTQHIRRSQFVLTYGPGAIIESRKGPRLIPSINRGLNKDFFSSEKFMNYEITDSRLRTILKNMDKSESRIFSLPSNAALGIPDNWSVYNTYLFPAWKICYNKDTHPHGRYIFYHDKECPICKEGKHSSAVRFVVACNQGHLDEVPWNYAVHSGGEKKDCKQKYFYWKTGGSSLSDIVVECPDCGSSISMQDIYQLKFNCTARSPEMEFPAFPVGPPYYPKAQRSRKCDEKVKVIQRQSSSLRVAETITLLTIPEYDNAISNILQRVDVAPAIGMLFSGNKTEDEEFIHKVDESPPDSYPRRPPVLL